MLTLFPLSVDPDPKLLQTIGPGVIWVSALLATLLSLNRLFQEDHRDGGLEQLILSPYPLSVIIFSKVCSHWLTLGLPLILLAPCWAGLFHLSMFAVSTLVISLLLGTPVLCLLGSIGAAVTVGLRNSGLLLALLLLPLYIPVMIFGTSAVLAADAHQSTHSQLALLGAMLAFLIILAPLAAAFALRVGISYDH